MCRVCGFQQCLGHPGPGDLGLVIYLPPAIFSHRMDTYSDRAQTGSSSDLVNIYHLPKFDTPGNHTESVKFGLFLASEGINAHFSPELSQGSLNHCQRSFYNDKVIYIFSHIGFYLTLGSLIFT